ncbi:MAG TPA: class I SAM-dependent methyltransferase [Micromonosporaceae bacterium]
MAAGPKAASTPTRSTWAVQTLAIQPSDRVLEIGCGRGAAIGLICPHLRDGTMTALDRSAAMVSLARSHNAEHVASGRARIELAAFGPEPLADQRFTKIFAINVSLFWAGTPTEELNLVRRLLLPGGRFYLFYEQHSPARAAAIAARLGPLLAECGFAARTRTAASRHAAMIALIADPVG